MHTTVSPIPFAALLGLCASTAAAGPLFVTSSADNGEGTLRSALEAASNSTESSEILLVVDETITLDSGLVYSGEKPLAIHGIGQVIAVSVNDTVFTASAGASVTMTSLTFEGPGGFDIENRTADAGKGIFIDVRDDQTGDVEVFLDNVTVRGVAGHGIHISDCTLADDCGAGGGGAGAGSPASVIVRLSDVLVEDAGNGRFDADGLRVDERGVGDIRVIMTASRFTDVGADGVELDEGQEGDVHVLATASSFDANGAYCDPSLLSSYLPELTEAEFEVGAMAENQIPGPISGSPDDGCYEREVDLYDDGSVEAYEFAIDVDDGFDIDEAGPGNIIATLADVDISSNLDEGADFDEEGPGDIRLTVMGGAYGGNADDGIKLSEEGDGAVRASVALAHAMDNGGKGMVFEEEDGGDVVLFLQNAMTSGNDDGVNTGVEAVQEDDGAGALTISSSMLMDGVDADGVDIKN